MKPKKSLVYPLPFWYNNHRFFEVEEFVQSTRRWLDRENPRDAGEVYACQGTYKANKILKSTPGHNLEAILRRGNRMIQFWIFLFLRLFCL